VVDATELLDNAIKAAALGRRRVIAFMRTFGPQMLRCTGIGDYGADRSGSGSGSGSGVSVNGYGWGMGVGYGEIYGVPTGVGDGVRYGYGDLWMWTNN